MKALLWLLVGLYVVVFAATIGVTVYAFLTCTVESCGYLLFVVPIPLVLATTVLACAVIAALLAKRDRYGWGLAIASLPIFLTAAIP